MRNMCRLLIYKLDFCHILQRQTRTVVSRTYENCATENSLTEPRRVKALVSHAVRGCCGPAGTAVSVCGILCLGASVPLYLAPYFCPISSY